MPSDRQKRLEDIERLVLKERDKIGKRTGVPFIVFPYSPDEGLNVDQEIRSLVKKLEFKEQNVAEVDLREMVFSALEDREILDNVIELERQDSDRLLEGLKSSLLNETDGDGLAARIQERAAEADTVIVHRMGILYPFASGSTLMGQLEGRTPSDTPIVFFYPASVEGDTLRFLDETEGAYYRARVVA